jgi:hypothetical protein
VLVHATVATIAIVLSLPIGGLNPTGRRRLR